MVTANIPAYLATWSDEFTSRADRVRNLIGDRHWLSDGTHKEFLVQEFLNRYLPNDLMIGRGFIRSLDVDEVSPEIDIVIADPKRHAPLLNEGGLYIVPPSAALATIEVKSTYRKLVLLEAFSNVARVRAVTQKGAKPVGLWSGVMFAHSEESLTLRKLLGDVKSILEEESFWAKLKEKQALSASSKLVPSIVCILNFCILFFDAEENSNDVVVRVFEAKRLSAALGFAQLFAYLRATLTNPMLPGELDSLLERIDGLLCESISISIPQS